jgi:hypothetical protein
MSPRQLLLLGVMLSTSMACTEQPAGSQENSEPATEVLPVGKMELDPATLDSTTLKELIAARESVWRAYFEGDSARLVELLPEQMFAMHDRAQIIADSRGFAANGGKFVGISFTDDRFFVRGNVAQVQSRYRVALTNAGQPDSMSGFAIELFEKRDGRWINPSWHLDDANRR